MGIDKIILPIIVTLKSFIRENNKEPSIIMPTITMSHTKNNFPHMSHIFSIIFNLL